MGREMTPWERYSAAISFAEPDFVPPVGIMTSYYYSWFNGIPESEFYKNPETMLKCQLAVQKRWPDLIQHHGLGPDFSIQFEPLAFGAKVKQAYDSPPWPIPILNRTEDIEKLEVPDPHTSGLCPKCLDYYKWMKEHTDAEFRRRYGYLEGWAFYVSGPFDIACHLRGVTNFMSDLYLHPKLAQKLLDVATEWTIAWLEVQQEEVVGDIRLLQISDDNSGNVNRSFFEEFALPHFKRIFDKFSKVPYRLFHNDANVKHIVDKIPEIGANAFIAFTPQIDISVFKRVFEDKMCLIGNIDPLNVLLRGTSQQVLEECRRQIEIAGPGGGFCLAAGGAIARNTPSENISTMIDAVKRYGRYPMAKCKASV